MRYPINWVAGFALLLVIGGLVASLVAVIFVTKVIRRLTWSRERAWRQQLVRGVAGVETCSRITEAGHCAQDQGKG